MTWERVTKMDQRVRFISEYLAGYFGVRELCRQFNISSKTSYKWISRYKKYGPRGLEDRSRKPHNCPHKTDDKVITAIKQVRYKHPTWGPKKILASLSRHHPDWNYPAISTAADILKREGLILPTKRRIRRTHPGCPRTVATQPNQIWSADYKGHFKMRSSAFRWNHRHINLSSTLIHEYIGLEEIDDGVYNVYYRDFLVGRFFEEILKVKDVIKRVPTRSRTVKKCHPCTQNNVSPMYPDCTYAQSYQNAAANADKPRR